MDGLRARLTFANVMSVVAVFIALGGVGYAATRLAKNSVGTKQIKNKAVTLTKINPAAQTSLKGQTGPQGVQGVQGVPGSDGLPGGASIGVASGPGTPPATADQELASVAIDLPQPAKLYVTGSSTASVTCTAAGTCSRRIGLYVDSAANPIALSEYDLEATASSTVTKDATLVGVTTTLPAGSHSLKMYATDVGNVASAADANDNIAAISLTG